MKRVRRLVAWLSMAVALAGAAVTKDARACGWSEETVFTTTVHPDLPMNPFAAGRLGLVRGEFARSYLAVAYRWMAGAPLDATEQAGALDLWTQRIGAEPWIVNSTIPSQGQSGQGASVSAPWDAALAQVASQPAGQPVTTSMTQNYATVENCLPDAFVTAARTLEDRSRRFGKESPRVKRWIEAQKQVFANCGGGNPGAIGPLPDTEDPFDRADRAYQVAAAEFYAGDLATAEQSFRAIGADPGSPWRATARLVVARTIVRSAMMAPTPDRARLAVAAQELRAILADRSLQHVHGAARRYEGIVLGRLNPADLAGKYAVRIARGGLGGDFRQVLNDYTWALDADPAPLALTAPDADRLSAWIGVMQGANPAAFDRAERLYGQTHAPVWLAAALTKAEVSHGARLEPLLRDAAAIGPESPAYATLQYQRFRLLTERGAAPRHAEIAAVRTQLGAGTGVSTLNAYKVLALRAAPDLPTLLDESHALPSGVASGDQPAAIPIPVPAGASRSDLEMFHWDAATTLSYQLPLATLEQAVSSHRLPKLPRAQLSTSVFVRAALLGKMDLARRVAQSTVTNDPALRGLVRAVLAARDAPHRRLAVLLLLLEAPATSWTVPSWRASIAAPGPIDTSYGEYWWCADAPKSPPPALPFLNTEQRKALAREQAVLRAMGAGPTFLAREAVRVADLLPDDPRVPKVLHLAVRASRYGCKDDETTPAARQAFQKLHRSYPKSEWTARTPYYY